MNRRDFFKTPAIAFMPLVPAAKQEPKPLAGKLEMRVFDGSQWRNLIKVDEKERA